MESSTQTAILVDAKREYQAQLCQCLTPTVLSVFEQMWDACAKDKKPLITFMTKLKGVPDVNNSIIQGWTQKVTERCPFFSELLAAVFVSYTKVLTSVRLGNVKPRIRLKVPSDETFVHSVMTDYAHELYDDPYLQQRTDNKSRGAKVELVHKAIETNVRNLLPVRDILNAYVSGASMRNREFDPEPPRAEEDSSEGSSDDEGEAAPQQQAEGDASGEEASQGYDEQEVQPVQQMTATPATVPQEYVTAPQAMPQAMPQAVPAQAPAQPMQATQGQQPAPTYQALVTQPAEDEKREVSLGQGHTRGTGYDDADDLE